MRDQSFDPLACSLIAASMLPRLVQPSTLRGLFPGHVECQRTCRRNTAARAEVARLINASLIRRQRECVFDVDESLIEAAKLKQKLAVVIERFG